MRYFVAKDFLPRIHESEQWVFSRIYVEILRLSIFYNREFVVDK